MLVALSAFFSVRAQHPLHGDRAGKPTVAAILNEYADSIAPLNYGITVLLKHDNKTETASIGLASAKEKLTDNHVFGIGSITKTFTAVLVMQEIEKGAMHLNDPVIKFLPYNPNVDSAITIEDLLRHTSGLGELAIDSFTNPAFANADSRYNHTYVYELIPRAHGKRGEKPHYCSTDYILLGYILEKINDVSYSDLLRERIFKPCGMEHSYPYVSKALPGLAHPMWQGHDLYEYIHYSFYEHFAFSAGSIASTTGDLLKFYERLYNSNSLISRESLSQMTSFKKTYGLGLLEMKVGNTTYWGHGGDIYSYSLQDYYNPANNTIMIIAGNQLGFKYEYPIAERILKTIDINGQH